MAAGLVRVYVGLFPSDDGLAQRDLNHDSDVIVCYLEPNFCLSEMAALIIKKLKPRYVQCHVDENGSRWFWRYESDGPSSAAEGSEASQEVRQEKVVASEEPSPPRVHSPEEIVAILHSITKLSVEDDELDAWFTDANGPSGIRSFIPGSFTRKLLELIENHLLCDC